MPLPSFQTRILPCCGRLQNVSTHYANSPYKRQPKRTGIGFHTAYKKCLQIGTLSGTRSSSMQHIVFHDFPLPSMAFVRAQFQSKCRDMQRYLPFQRHTFSFCSAFSLRISVLPTTLPYYTPSLQVSIDLLFLVLLHLPTLLLEKESLPSCSRFIAGYNTSDEHQTF